MTGPSAHTVFGSFGNGQQQAPVTEQQAPGTQQPAPVTQQQALSLTQDRHGIAQTNQPLKDKMPTMNDQQ